MFELKMEDFCLGYVMATDGDSFLSGKVSRFFVDDLMERDTGWRRLLQV